MMPQLAMKKTIEKRHYMNTNNKSITKIMIPSGSEIEKFKKNAYFFDAHETSIFGNEKSALGIYLDMVKNTPRWVNSLMDLRNKTVLLVGLKDLGHLGDIDQLKSEKDYKIGDRVGIFVLLYKSEKEIILGDSDKHLDVKLSVYKASKTNINTVAISTVVHVNNMLGRFYMACITPLHKLIAPAMISKVSG